ncbi:uncharacterized protein KY384_001720 [Bacidia gigantensis]|uniref:uncharacterized protein n=1 Tax=Bacidia gigantensis TaxID=2732470 RepID=UPI001D059564|nr:uncharacterized protein KY384_001720 [Bacidia gigantensis]KAG8533977.1 hypothetical protein KY384_001720 [Bacidia gigantensis]
MTAHTGLTPAVLKYKAPDPLVLEFEVQPDRAGFAEPKKSALFAAASKVDDLTPWIGTQLHGVQLSQLTDAQKDDLALLVAERGVVFFKDQDLTLDGQYELTKHYGVQDRDPNQHDPKHVTILGRDNDRGYANFGQDFHNDHSFELNPPAYTILRMVKAPPTGGDTIFTSQVALFDKLSPTYQKLLEPLHGVHSSEVSIPPRAILPLSSLDNLMVDRLTNIFSQASYINSINGGGIAFRPPIRTHPITHLKSLFYNPTFTLHIAELKEAESAHLLSFLREHMHSADDLTVRWRWEAGSVAFWDNRVVAHRAVPGGYDKRLREGKRTGVFGERPIFDAERGVTWGERFAGAGVGVGEGEEGGRGEGMKRGRSGIWTRNTSIKRWMRMVMRSKRISQGRVTRVTQ